MFTTSLGSAAAVDLSNTSLTTSYVGGRAMAAEGTAEVSVDLDATFRSATDLTSMEFRFATSDDQVVWRPCTCLRGSDGAPLDAISLAAVAGSTVRERMLTTSHAAAKYIRVEAKHTGGTPTAADLAQAVNPKAVI